MTLRFDLSNSPEALGRLLIRFVTFSATNAHEVVLVTDFLDKVGHHFLKSGSAFVSVLAAPLGVLFTAAIVTWILLVNNGMAWRDASDKRREIVRRGVMALMGALCLLEPTVPAVVSETMCICHLYLASRSETE